jgi:NitT/TauT family transport system substrate-binding protein
VERGSRVFRLRETLLTAVRLRLLWHPQPQFAGYLLAQHAGFAAARGIALECVPMDFALGPIDAVLTGDCTFAVASPAHAVESRAPNELVMLLAIQQTSALVYGARRSAGIASAVDLAGKRVAVWPGGEDLELRWMLARAGVAPGAVELVPAGDTVAALLDGSVDAAQLTTYHEIFELAHAAGSLEPFVLLRAADHGAALLKDGLFARRDVVAAQPALVQATIDAVLDGWTAAFNDPDAAIDLCASLRPDLDRAHHARQLAAIRQLALCGATLERGLGYPDPAHVTAALDARRDVEGRAIDADGPAAAFADDRWWQAAPAAVRASAW